MATIQECHGNGIYLYWHTKRDGMYVCYAGSEVSECVWFVPGAPVGVSDSPWDDF